MMKCLVDRFSAERTVVVAGDDSCSEPASSVSVGVAWVAHRHRLGCVTVPLASLSRVRCSSAHTHAPSPVTWGDPEGRGWVTMRG